MDDKTRRSERLCRAEPRRRAPFAGQPPAGPQRDAAPSLLDVELQGARSFDPDSKWFTPDWRPLTCGTPVGRPGLWIPRQGVNDIRVLPPEGQEAFYFQVPWHFNVGGREQAVPCRARIVQPCYVCNRVARLATCPSCFALEMAAAMRVQFRYFVYIIDVDAPDLGVQVWTAAQDQIQQILSAMMWIPDLLDPQTGRTIRFTSLSGEGYPPLLSDLRFSPNPSPIPYPGWRDELKPRDELLPLISNGEQERIYKGEKSRSAAEGRAVEDC